jgi:hypothetical protein
MPDVMDETENIRAELLGYSRNAEVDSSISPQHQEIITFSLQNTSSDLIEIYSDEYTIVGDDKFAYDYIEKPWRELPNFPSHYVSEYGCDIPSDSKVRVLIVSKPIPSSVSIRKLNYDYQSHSFTLELSEEFKNEADDPPL